MTLHQAHVSKQDRGPACTEPQPRGQEHPVDLYGVPNVLGAEGSYPTEGETEARRSEEAPIPWGHE